MERRRYVMAALRVAVLGAGTMGNGIAQVFAQHGHAVILRDLTDAILERAVASIDKSLSKLAEKGKISAADREASIARITRATDMGAVAECDLVVEAAVENLAIKSELFRELDRLTGPSAILSSNT